MHEIRAMQTVIRTILACMQQAGASHVTHAQLALSVSEHVTAEVAHQSFEMLTRGTPIEGASLSIQWVPATYQCLTCLYRFENGEPSEQVLCPKCGEAALEVERQEVCVVRSLDVSFSDAVQSADSSLQPELSLLAGERSHLSEAEGGQ